MHFIEKIKAYYEEQEAIRKLNEAHASGEFTKNRPAGAECRGARIRRLREMGDL